MAYATEIAKDYAKAEQFVLLEPKRRMFASDFTLYSGSVYSSSVPEFVASVSVAGSALTEGSSASLSAGQFYYDYSTSTLYVRKSDSTAPTDANFVVAGIELYLCDTDRPWHRRPDDNTYRSVQWNGLITDQISIRRSISNLMQGFYPSQSSPLKLIFDPNILQKVIFDCSFYLTSATVWFRYGDEFSTGNFKKVFTGLTENLSISDGEEFLTLNILDKIHTLDNPVQYSDGVNFLSKSTHSGYSSDKPYQPIRMIYGNCPYLRATYVGQVGGLDTYIFGKNEHGDMGTAISAEIVDRDDDFSTEFSSGNWNAIPGDFGKIFVNAHGVGAHAGNDDYIRITKATTPEVTHSTLDASMWNESPPDVFRWARNSYVVVKRNSSTFGETELKPYLHFTPYSTSDYWGIQLTAAGSVVGGDQIWGWCQGSGSQPTISGSPFGSILTAYYCVSNSVVVLYDFLKRIVGISESLIDTASFQAAETYGLDVVDCRIPDSYGSDFPTFKEVVTRLLYTSLSVGFFDDAGKFVIKPIAQITGETPDHSIDETDIVDNSVSHDFNLTDVGKIRVHYLQSDIDFVSEQTYLSSPPTDLSLLPSGYLRSELFEANNNIYVADGGREYDLYPYASEYPNGSYNGGSGLAGGSTAEVTTWANKVADIFSQRSGRIKLTLRHPFVDMELYDIVQVSRKIIPGYAYDADTVRVKNFRIVEIEKSPDRISIVLDDQKAIEESTVW